MLKKLTEFKNLLRFLFVLLLTTYSHPGFTEQTLCAVVKIEIRQELTLERQAFDAHMRINNGLETLPLENVAVNVTFVDESGTAVVASSDPNETSATFFIRVDSLEGIAALDGTGSIAPSSTADIHWLIIPAPGAAAGAPQGSLYFVGASLSYIVGGEPESVEVAPDTISVKPLPQLSLDYFLTEQVYADEPFSLGVRVSNNSSAATAKDVSIDSAQPTIVENEQGLLIDFRIVGASANGQPIPNSLLVNLGDIGPESSSVGRWSMLTTLSGQFTDFTATVAHSDELGGELTSLLDDPVTHFLVRDVRVDLPGRDGVRDFLALDGDTLRVYESSGLDTAVTEQSATLDFDSQSGSDLFHTLSTGLAAGFVYARVPDQYLGTKEIKAVTRSDGKVIDPANVWLSRSPKPEAPLEWDYYLNLFDANTTGTYVVVLADPVAGPSAPVFAPVAGAVTYEGNPVGFTVTATDADGTMPMLTTAPLPVGANFTDNGDGTGTFNWAPAVGQAGDYHIVFAASDGELTDETVVAIKVNPAWDTDGDGMDDAWELQHFGDLTRDGTGDFDGDGISDLLEYQQGYDPNLDPPLPPAGVTALAGNERITLSWNASDGATAYNAYWANATGVSPATGMPLTDVVSPHVVGELTNETAYYYVVTAIGPGGESAPSVEVSAIPGATQNWGAPERIEQDDAGPAQSADVAKAPSGDGMAVWSHFDGSRANIWANRYVAGGGWQIPEVIEIEDLGDAVRPQIATDTVGNAVAVWEQSDGTNTHIRANRYTAGTGWGSAASVETNAVDAFSPRLTMDPAGNATVLWRQGDGLWFNRYDAQSGTWGVAEQIASGTGIVYPAADLDADDNGHVFAVWSQTSDGQSFAVYARRYVPDTGWDAAQLLDSAVTTGAVSPAVVPALAVSGGGDALALWERSDGTGNDIWASRYTGGIWSAPFRVETHVGDGFSPAVAYAGDGTAVAAWLRNDGNRTSIWANRMDVDGVWQTAAAIETDDTADAAAVQVAADGFGNAFAVWHQGDGWQDNIWAARHAAGSGWEPPVIIDTENDGPARFPALAVDSNGGALAVWEQSDGGLTHITANAYAAGQTGVPNIVPVVRPGPNQEVSEGTAVSLGGNAVFDQDGTVASYAWSQTGGPAVTLTGADSIEAGFTAPAVYEPTVLTFELAATDDLGAVNQANVQVTVLSVELDDDGDGMGDLWEIQAFGTLDRDGTLDFDGDGFTDLAEYQQGSDATLPTPATPTGVQATSAIGQVTLSWQPVTGATNYNIYWSTDPGVTPATGTSITGATSPYLHAGLNPGTMYYYIVTAVADDESTPSAEVSASAGRRAWETAEVIPGATGTVSSALVVGDSVVAVWSDAGNILSSVYSDAAGWGTAQPVESSAETATAPQVAADGLGNATAVWLQSDGTTNNIWANHYTAGTGWGAAEVIAADVGTAEALQVDMDSTGAAIVVWRVPDGYWANRFDPGIGWSTAEMLASIGNEPDYGAPELAMGADGSAVVAWERLSDNFHTLVEAIRYQEAVGWGSVELVADVPISSSTPDTPAIDLGAGADATVIWPVANTLFGSRYTPEGGWQTAEQITSGDHIYAADVAIVNDGAMATWSTGDTLYAAEYSPDTGWSAPEKVTSMWVTVLKLAVDSNGGVTLAYVGRTWQPHMWAVTRAPGSDWSTPQLLSSASAATSSPVVHSGNAEPLAIWASSSGEIFSSRYRLFGSPPFANTGPQETVYSGQSIVLDGSGSTDLDGAIQSYGWVLADPLPEWFYASEPEGTATEPGWSALTSETVTTAVHQYALVVTDDDGAMVTEIATVTVLGRETDGDGMDDLWESQNFGDIDVSDGTADGDGDGLTDLQEFEQGSDPAVPNLAAPTGLTAAPSPSEISVSWEPVAGATGYNLYWSTQPGVTPSTGTLVPGVNSPFAHTGLDEGITYYYVVTAVDAAGESAPSAEVRATPGTWSWTDVGFVEKNGGGTDEPDVAMNDSGNALAVWSQADGTTSNIWANRYTAGAGWGTPVLIESDDTGRARDPSVALNDNDDGVIVWEQSNDETTRFWANRYSASSGWGAAEVISSTDQFSALSDGRQDIDVGIDDAGNAIAVWRQMNGSRFDIWANRYEPGVGWGTAQTIESDDSGNAHLPRIGMSSGGRAVAAWYQSDGTRNNVWANTFVPDSGWGGAQLIEADDTGPAYYAEVAVDGAGNAVAVWIQSDGTRYNIMSNRYSVTSGWGSAETIETDDSGSAYYPRVATDGGGNAIAVWHHWDGTRYNIQANRYAAGSGWGAAQLIETNDAGSAYYPDIAMDTGGDAAIVWHQYDGSEDSAWSARYVAGTGWSVAEEIDDPSGGSAYKPRIAMSGSGESTVVWNQWSSDTQGYSVWSRRQDGNSWESAQTIDSDQMGGAYRPRLAIDGNGNAFAVWHQNDNGRYDVWVNRYEPGAGWGQGQLLEANDLGDALNPDVAVNDSGYAVAVWSQSNGVASSIWATVYTPGTGWSSPELIEVDDAGDADQVRVAVDGTGNAIAVWVQSDGKYVNVWANRYQGEVGWGTPEQLTDNRVDDLRTEVAVNAAGNAVAVWEEEDNQGIASLAASYYTPGSGWSPAGLIENLDTGHSMLSGSSVGIDAAGNALVAWEQYNGSSTDMWANRFTFGSGWGVAELIETGAQTGSESPRLAVTENGEAVAVWEQVNDSSYFQIWANRYVPGVGWATAEEFASLSGVPSVAVDGSGNAIAIVQGDNGDIWAMHYSADSGWGEAAAIGHGENTSEDNWRDVSPAIAMNGSGDTLVVWEDFRWTASSIVGRYYATDTPPLADAGPDQSVYGGQSVSLDGTGSTDAGGSIESYNWSQVSGPSVTLDNPNVPAPGFVAPQLSGRTSVTFVLTVTDKSGSRSSDTVIITVLEPDSDGDGMADLWELQYFGDLSRDGTLDFDGDGLSDFNEYQQGTDPTAMVPASPTGVEAGSMVGGAVMSWSAVPEADSYNLYWSTAPGVDPGTADRIVGVANPYFHAGLSLGQRYYYVVTAVGAGGESGPSAEVSTLAGQWVWELPYAVENTAGDAGPVSVAANAAGDAVAVWEQSDGIRTNIWASRYSAGLGWGVAQLIETDDAGSATNARVVMDSAGNALAVWQQSDGTRTNIRSNRYTTGIGWGSAEFVEFDDLGAATNPRLAVDGEGGAIAVWEQSDGTRTNIVASRYSVGLGWGTAELVETDDTGAATHPAIATDSAGNAIAVWQHSDGIRTNIRANAYLVGSGWATAVLIESDDLGDASLPTVAMDGSGNAVAAWEQSDGVRTNIRANRYTAGVGWGTAALIETDDSGAATNVQLAIDGSGTATAAWEQSDGLRTNIWANRNSGAGWDIAQLIETDDTGGASAAVIAADGNGDAVVLWQQGDGTRLNIQANRYRAGEGWGIAQIIESDDSGDALAPALALDGQGNAIGIWHQWDGGAYSIESARNTLQ